MSYPGGNDRGFSLLEVVITLAILVTIIFSVSTLLRSTVDVRLGLSSKNRVTQRMNRAMLQISSDLAHAYLLDAKNFDRGGVGRKRTLFHIKRQGGGSGDLLEMTYMGHRARRANSPESDYSFVVYEIAKSEEFSHRSNLTRGELPRIPSVEYDFKEKPPMEVFIPHVKNLRLEAWIGDSWSKNGWDSRARETENKIPQMVRVIMEFWEDDPVSGEDQLADENGRTVIISTVVSLPYAMDIKELKGRTSSLDLSKLL